MEDKGKHRNLNSRLVGAPEQSIKATDNARVEHVQQIIAEHVTLENYNISFDAARLDLRNYSRIDDFKTLITERTKDFVGREFIFKEIDQILTTDPLSSGYVLVRG